MGSNVFAVLTGDVIDSAKRDHYGKALDEVFSRFISEYGDRCPDGLAIDRFSGDMFQFLLNDPRLSLRSALYLYTKLASLENPVPVRISIGIGSINTLPDRRVSNGDGEAFRLSGISLEQMKKHQRLCLHSSPGILDGNLQNFLQGSMELLSAVLIDLSPGQAEVVWYGLNGFTQQEIAEKTDRTQQTISDLSIAGHWKNIQGFLTVFERQLEDFMG